MSVTSKTKLLEKLKKKTYRDAYVEEHVTTSLPFQMIALREQREWSQGELGRRVGMRQNAVSRLEDAESGTPSITTLLRLAKAFDVALLVKFVPFRRLLAEFGDLSTKALEVSSFDQELPELEQITAMTSWHQGSFARAARITPGKFEADITAVYPIAKAFQEYENPFEELRQRGQISGGSKYYYSFVPAVSAFDALSVAESTEDDIIDYTQATLETPVVESTDLLSRPSVFARGGNTQHVS